MHLKRDNPHDLSRGTNPVGLKASVKKSAFLSPTNLNDQTIESWSYLLRQRLSSSVYLSSFQMREAHGVQVWFQDLAFRSGVYRCQPSDSSKSKFKESPIFQLQVTFTALQEGALSVFNPIKLVESLRLRTSEQQDAQE